MACMHKEWLCSVFLYNHIGAKTAHVGSQVGWTLYMSNIQKLWVNLCVFCWNTQRHSNQLHKTSRGKKRQCNSSKESFQADVATSSLDSWGPNNHDLFLPLSTSNSHSFSSTPQGYNTGLAKIPEWHCRRAHMCPIFLDFPVLGTMVVPHYYDYCPVLGNCHTAAIWQLGAGRRD